MKKWFNSPIGVSIISIIVGIGSSYVTQRMFISIADENNLIRDLIPSLVSEKAKERKMALLILKEVSPDKYETINGILLEKEQHRVMTMGSQPIQNTDKVQTLPLDELREARPELRNLISQQVQSTTHTITIKWQTEQPVKRYVLYGTNGKLNRQTVISDSYSKSHSVILTGLRRSTFYSIQVRGVDPSGAEYAGDVITVRTRQ
jgi:hypothetical protein